MAGVWSSIRYRSNLRFSHIVRRVPQFRYNSTPLDSPCQRHVTRSSCCCGARCGNGGGRPLLPRYNSKCGSAVPRMSLSRPTWISSYRPSGALPFLLSGSAAECIGRPSTGNIIFAPKLGDSAENVSFRVRRTPAGRSRSALQPPPVDGTAAPNLAFFRSARVNL